LGTIHLNFSAWMNDPAGQLRLKLDFKMEDWLPV